MAKLSLNLDERSIKNGMAHIRMRINHRGTSAFVGTGVYVEPEYFIAGSLYDPIHRKAYMAIEKRDKVAALVQQVDEWLHDVNPSELAGMTATDIRERALACVHAKPTSSPDDFLAWYEQYANSRRTEKTKSSYLYGLTVLREYCAACRVFTLSFKDIDYSRLSDIAQWLRSTGRSESTRHIIESYIRAAYKEAQKRHLVSRENDPYYDYSIAPIPVRDIDCLTADQMRILKNAPLRTKGMEWARDLALMSFYLCGANLLDLYEMPEPVACEVVFVRHKVELRDQRPLHIRIEPELQELIRKYKGKGALLSFKAKYANYESFRHKIGHRLTEVSCVVGFNVTMAKIRRTWATIAGSLDISDRVIDKSMGHVDSTVKNKHYEQYDWDRTARANRAVIDAIS